MFCNGPKMDEGDIAHLGPTTIIGMTILRCYSSSIMTLDDTGCLAGPITNMLYLWNLVLGFKYSLVYFSRFIWSSGSFKEVAASEWSCQSFVWFLVPFSNGSNKSLLFKWGNSQNFLFPFKLLFFVILYLCDYIWPFP